jgi:hypothetical protein
VVRFEVVGLVEDEEGNAYAICFSEPSDQFVVTDEFGDLLDSDKLGQEILENYFTLIEEAAPPEEPA